MPNLSNQFFSRTAILLLLCVAWAGRVDASDSTAPVLFSLSGSVTVNGAVASGATLSLQRAALPLIPPALAPTPTATGTPASSVDIGSGPTTTIPGPPPGPPVGLTTTTDANGNYSFSIPAGTYLVTPQNPMTTFNPPSLTVTIAADTSGENFAGTQAGIANPFAGRYSGNATVAAGPDAGATEALAGNVTAGGNMQLASTTAAAIIVGASGSIDGNGDFTLTNGPLAITGTASGSGAAIVSTGTFSGAGSAGADSGTLSLTIVPASATYTISGQVSDLAGGVANIVVTLDNGAPPPVTPASGTSTASGADGQVRAPAPRSGTIGLGVKTTLTDSNGDYVFSGLNPGIYGVVPSSASYLFAPPSARVIIASADEMANFTAVPTYSIGGTATVNGTPQAGVVVSLKGILAPAPVSTGTAASTTTAAPPPVGEFAVTDHNGQYLFSGLTNGVYTLTASSPNVSFAESPATVSIANASATQNFTGTSALTISGHVTLNGLPQPGVTVSLTSAAAATTTPTVTTTDGSGRYSFFVAAGSYTVAPSYSGATFVPPSAAVTITTTSAGDIDFAGTLPLSIGGYVTDGTAPVVGATVTLGSASAAPAGPSPAVAGATNASPVANTQSTTTDATGYYSFTNLAAGIYTVAVSATGYTVTPPSTTVLLSNDSLGLNFSAAPVPVATSSTATNSRVSSAASSATTTSDTSPVVLSRANAIQATGEVRLIFTGALDAGAAVGASHYSVVADNQTLQILGVSYLRSGNVVTLTVQLPRGAGLVTVRWTGLTDSQERVVKDSSATVRVE